MTPTLQKNRLRTQEVQQGVGAITPEAPSQGVSLRSVAQAQGQSVKPTAPGKGCLSASPRPQPILGLWHPGDAWVPARVPRAAFWVAPLLATTAALDPREPDEEEPPRKQRPPGSGSAGCEAARPGIEATACGITPARAYATPKRRDLQGAGKRAFPRTPESESSPKHSWEGPRLIHHGTF